MASDGLSKNCWPPFSPSKAFTRPATLSWKLLPLLASSLSVVGFKTNITEEPVGLSPGFLNYWTCDSRQGLTLISLDLLSLWQLRLSYWHLHLLFISTFIDIPLFPVNTICYELHESQHSRNELQRGIHMRQRGSYCELEQNSWRVLIKKKKVLVNFWQESIEDN